MCVITAALMVAALCAVPASAASVKLNKTSVNLPIGYTTTLKVSGADSVKWSSKDSSIAKVKSAKGNTAKISGLKSGSTYIYAKVGKTTLKCKVTVKKSFISASSSNVSLAKGGSQTITLTVKGSKDIALSNSDKNVCTTKWGKWDGDKIKLTINAKNPGTAQIKIYTKKYSKSTAKTINVTVNGNNSADIEEEEEAIIFSNGEYVFIIEFEPSDGQNTGTALEPITAEEDTSANSSEIEKVVELVNKEREAVGASALKSDPKLNNIAALRAKEIVESFSHTRPDGSSCFTAFESAGITNVYMGENIAAGQRNASEVMDSWMNSAGHKANILSRDFTRIGVGFCKSNSGYGYYWVQVFTSEF